MLALGLSLVPLAGCGIVFGSGFEEDVVIPTSDYRIEDLVCEGSPGESNVEGETVVNTHWTFSGDFTNTLDQGSKNYEIRVNVVFSDGTTKVASDLVFPLASGDSTEISGFITAAIRLEDPDATVTECTDVTVYDSVLNH